VARAIHSGHVAATSECHGALPVGDCYRVVPSVPAFCVPNVSARHKPLLQASFSH
jgi:hypothetical protein